MFGSDISNEVNENILSQQKLFGGPSDLYKDNNTDVLVSPASDSVLAALVPSSTSARESYRIQACNLIVQNDNAVRFAGKQVRNLTSTSFMNHEKPTVGDIKYAYDLFSPGRVPPQQVLDSLKVDVVDYSSTAGMNAFDSWRFLFLTLCISPHWEVL